MSGSKSVAVSGGGYMAPFTAVQWQELEHQALIYKYLVAGVPVPSELVLPIRRSLEALSARLFHHPALGYSSYYGKKYDPEPGRCRRTDGKKWRCAKEAYQESKYCERHMNRGRNRSRKPVESQSTSQSSLSTNTTAGGGKGCYQNVTTSKSTTQSLYSITNSGSYNNYGNNASKLQVDTNPYGINTKDIRYSQGLAVNVDDENYTCGNLNMDSCNVSWNTNPLQLNMTGTFESIIDADSISMSSKQHCFFGSEFDPDFNARNVCPTNDA